MTQYDPVYFLLVDDLEENLIALEALLRRDGLEILKARSGTEALELLLEHEVALAFVDIQMPGMDGFELAEFMRGKERTKDVPIIFLTAGMSDKQRRFRGYEAGAVDFLFKPLEPEIVKSKAAIFFELYRRRQEVAQQRDALKQATEEAQIYAKALKEANKRKDEFLATLAHELRNPLAPIRNGMEILRHQPVGEAADHVRGIIDHQLSHMVRLIDDLLDMSRISKGKIDLRKTTTSLQSAIKAATEAAEPLLKDHNHTLAIDMPDAPIWLDADPTRLEQMIGNLLNNAAKYTQDGGNIYIKAQTEDNQAVIAVVDNGAGIPADMRANIFDLFTQVNSTLQQSQGGLGIGLALVRHLVHLHKGEIDVQSEGENKGSTFIIKLPLGVAPEVAAPPAQKSRKNGAKQNLRILIVDDNVESAQTTGWMLEMIGHEYELAHEGVHALALAETFKPDAILLDIGLPDINGYEICKTLRSMPQFENTLIIAQTGWGQKRDRELAKEAGFNHHLVKPLSLDQITDLLH